MTIRNRIIQLLSILLTLGLIGGLAGGCQSIDESLATGGEASDGRTLSLGITGTDGSDASGEAGAREALRFADDAGIEYTVTHARVYLRDIELDLPMGMRCADLRDQLAGGAVCKSDVDDDDGTPDQGSGDAPGTDGADDNPSDPSGDDDGTADQGSGDQKSGSDDDRSGSSDDDGTADQGSGDAPGTPGSDDVDDDSVRGDDDDDRTILIPGPFVVDLMTGESTPSLADVRVPAVAYSRIDVRIDDGELDEGLLEPGDELVDRSLVVRADLVYMDTPVELRLSLKFNEDVRFEAPGGVPAGPELSLELDVSRWLDGIRFGDCLDDGDLVVEDGVMVVDDDSGEGECSDVEGDIKDNVKESGRIRG